MDKMPDWGVWILAAGVAALFLWFFWHVGSGMLAYGRQLIGMIQNWPQIRRSMVEAEVRAGGRYPLWFRAVRVLLIVAMVVFAGLLVWRKVSGSF
jgi:hypothetical protein